MPPPLGLDRAAGRLDRLHPVDHRPEAVVGHVGRRHRMARRSCRLGRRLARHAPGRRVGANRSFLTITNGGFASRPCSCRLHRAARPVVGAAVLKERQQALRAVSRPGRQKAVPGGIERAATMNRNKPPISNPQPSFAPPMAKSMDQWPPRLVQCNTWTSRLYWITTEPAQNRLVEAFPGGSIPMQENTPRRSHWADRCQ